MSKIDQSETFAVCQAGDEAELQPGHLSLSQAFAEVLRRAHMRHAYDVKEDQHRLLLHEEDAAESDEPWLVLLSDYGSPATARRDLMTQACGGCVKDFVAVPDSLIRRVARDAVVE